MPGTEENFASVASEPGRCCGFFLVSGLAGTPLLHYMDVADVVSGAGDSIAVAPFSLLAPTPRRLPSSSQCNVG
ncbi:unnamed protein product [Lampetra planeri]